LDFFQNCCKVAEKGRRKIEPSPAAGRVKKTLFEAVFDAVDASSAHQFFLMLLWASQANALPVRQCLLGVPSCSE